MENCPPNCACCAEDKLQDIKEEIDNIDELESELANNDLRAEYQEYFNPEDDD